MEHLYQRYVDNLIEAYGLIKPGFKPNMTEEQFLQAIRENATRIYEIHTNNNQILNEVLFSKKADTLTEEEVSQLSELAEALFHFNRSLDTGIAYRIHQLIYTYAQYHEDIDLMIRELYYQGITLFYLNIKDDSQKVDLFHKQIGEYFRMGASYLERYEELKNPQTRNYILRCLGNIKYGLSNSQDDDSDYWTAYMKCFNKAMEVFESPHYRQMNPEIPWDSYVYTMHYDRTKFLSALRDKDDPDIAQGVMYSADYIYHHQEQISKTSGRSVGVRTLYVHITARYHMGLATIQELMDTLFELCESADIHDFSGDNIWTLLSTPEYLTRYARCLSREEHQAIQSRLDLAMEKQKEYLFLLPNNEYGLQVSQAVQRIAMYLSRQDITFSHRLLDYILACHPPTFVHSRMVALLTRWFCARLVQVNPELLSGTFGFDEVDEPSGNLEQLLELAYESGLYHDLGKCMLLNYVGCYSRNLLDEEFACIKLHPFLGCNLLKALQMDDMAKIAYCHHRSYDGRRGYPNSDEDCPVRDRLIADIVTVVDALDAGTDNIGRCYAAAKDYEKLVGELQSGKNTMYDPEIVRLFDDPGFYEETKQFLKENRKRVYLEVYNMEQ